MPPPAGAPRSSLLLEPLRTASCSGKVEPGSAGRTRSRPAGCGRGCSRRRSPGCRSTPPADPVQVWILLHHAPRTLGEDPLSEYGYVVDAQAPRGGVLDPPQRVLSGRSQGRGCAWFMSGIVSDENQPSVKFDAVRPRRRGGSCKPPRGPGDGVGHELAPPHVEPVRGWAGPSSTVAPSRQWFQHHVP